LFDKNSPWDELKISPKGVVCQGKKPQVKNRRIGDRKEDEKDRSREKEDLPI